MLRNILLGKTKIESRSEYKYAMLRAQLGLLLGSICITYIFIDTFSGVPVYIPSYIIGIILSFLVIALNRNRKYILSSVILIITANMLVFLIASLEASEGGAFFYFMATSATSIVVLNPINKRLGLLFVALSIFLAALAYFGNGLPLEAPEGNENYETISFTTNFLLGLLSCVLILVFVVNRNEESETSLLKNQTKLELLTQELERSKNRFSRAVDGTKAGIYEWNINSNKAFVSARYKELLGFDAEEEYDMSLDFLRSLIHPKDKNAYIGLTGKATRKMKDYQLELRLRHNNGYYRWFLDSGIVSKEKSGLSLAVGSIIDINDRKIAEQQLTDQNDELEKTNQELDRFVYSASHDMRAPLTTLLGLLNLAKLTDDTKELHEYHDMMRNRIMTMEGFIKEVTDYSRNSRLEVKWEKISGAELSRELQENLEFMASSYLVKLDFPVSSQLSLYCDRQRLKVILNNLIENAIKYHDKNKSNRFVRLSFSQETSEFIINIADNGIGIKEKYQERIYDMFFRASERSEGSGLGLYIVKETLEKLNASIGCFSEEGIGTKFTIKISQSINP